MRRDMVTRTVLGTKVVAKVVNPATEEISTAEVKLTGSYSTEDGAKLNKALVKALGDIILIKVESVEPFNKLYGVDTKYFMSIAMELDPETRKPLAVDSEPVNEQ